MSSRWPWRAALTLTLLAVVAGTTHAQPKADVVRLANGDHITGEVEALNRGRLELSTDDAGTLYFEWDKIVSLSAVGQFEVTTTDGRRFLGGLAAGDPKTLVIVEAANRVPLSMNDVAAIVPDFSSHRHREQRVQTPGLGGADRRVRHAHREWGRRRARR